MSQHPQAKPQWVLTVNYIVDGQQYNEPVFVYADDAAGAQLQAMIEINCFIRDRLHSDKPFDDIELVSQAHPSRRPISKRAFWQLR